jgi:hypothetical protein
MNFDKRYNELLGIGRPALEPKARNPKGYDPISKTPSWLALAALNEIVASEEEAKLSRGAATEPLPSIKEQLSQKAASMQADAQKQQSAMQRMSEQMAQAPQPTPEGIPQPKPQPQEEPPVMMAHGGLARLPIDSRMFDYREGGIISFQSQGAVPSADEAGANLAAVQAQAQQAIDNLRRFGLAQQQQNPGEYQRAVQAAKAAQQAITAAQKQYEASISTAGMDKPAFITGRAGVRPLPRSESEGPSAPPNFEGTADMGARDRSRMGLASVAPAPAAAPSAAPLRPRAAPPAAAAPRPAQPPAQPPAQQAPAGLTALPDPIKTAQGISAAFPIAGEKPDADALLAEREKFRQASGARRVGEPQQEELSAYQAETARLRKARDEANAMETLSGYGGLAGLGQRRAAIMQRDNLADTIRNDATEKMRVAMEGMKQAEAEGNMTKFAALKKEFTDAQNARATANALAASKLASDNVQANTAREGNISAEGIASRRDDTSIKVANIQAATANAAKALGADDKKVQMAEAAFARDPEVKRILDLLKTAPYTMGASAAARAKPYEDQLRKIQGEKYAAFGIKLEGSPGATAPASAPQRMKFDAKGNPI